MIKTLHTLPTRFSSVRKDVNICESSCTKETPHMFCMHSTHLPVMATFRDRTAARVTFVGQHQGRGGGVERGTHRRDTTASVFQ